MPSDVRIHAVVRLRRRITAVAGRLIDKLTAHDLATHQAAVVRIGIAAVAVLFMLHEFAERHEVWGDRSPWTADMAIRGFTFDGGFSLLLASPDRWWFEGLYLLTIVTGLLVMLGWHTRICQAIFAVLLLSFEYRSFPMIDGGDKVVQLLVVYLVFTRCGKVWSLDARRRARHGPHTARRAAGGLLAEWREVADRLGSLVHNCAMFVIAAQVCVIYATAGLTKVQGWMWQDGTALWYVLHLDYMRPFPALSEMLVSSALAVLVIGYLTVLIQVAFPFCVFNRRLKNCLLVALVAEHLGIAVLMGLPFFSLAMIVADSVFLPTAWLLTLATWTSAGGHRLMSVLAQARVVRWGTSGGGPAMTHRATCSAPTRRGTGGG